MALPAGLLNRRGAAFDYGGLPSKGFAQELEFKHFRTHLRKLGIVEEFHDYGDGDGKVLEFRYDLGRVEFHGFLPRRRASDREERNTLVFADFEDFLELRRDGVVIHLGFVEKHDEPPEAILQ